MARLRGEIDIGLKDLGAGQIVDGGTAFRAARGGTWVRARGRAAVSKFATFAFQFASPTFAGDASAGTSTSAFDAK